MSRKIAVSLYYETYTDDTRPMKDIEQSFEDTLFDILDLHDPKLHALVMVQEVPIKADTHTPHKEAS